MQATGSHCYLIVNNAITKRFLVKQPLSDWFHLTSQSKNTTPTPSATCSCLTSNMGDYYQAICAWCPARNSHSFDVFLVVWRKKFVVWSINHLLSFVCWQFCIVVSDHMCFCLMILAQNDTIFMRFMRSFFLPTVFFLVNQWFIQTSTMSRPV